MHLPGELLRVTSQVGSRAVVSKVAETEWPKFEGEDHNPPRIEKKL